MIFFRHDCDAHDSKFFQGLIANFGVAGYGRFYILLELCYGQLKKTDDSFIERCHERGVEFQFHPRIVLKSLISTEIVLSRMFNYCQKTSDFSWTETGQWSNDCQTTVQPSLDDRQTMVAPPLDGGRTTASGRSTVVTPPWIFRVPNILKRLPPKEKQYWSQFDWGLPREEKKRRDKKREEEKDKKEILVTPPERPPEPEAPPPCKLHSLTNIWNLNCGPLGKVKIENRGRKKRIALRWKEAPDDPEKYWTEIVQRITKSDFCIGKNENAWVASFDWILRPETHLKVNEGKYDNRHKLQRQTFQQAKTQNNKNLYEKFEGGVK